MHRIKAGAAGLVGSLFIFIVMFVGVNVTASRPSTCRRPLRFAPR